MKSGTILLVCFAILGYTYGIEEKFGKGYSLKVLGQSGKMSFCKEKKTCVVIDMVKMSELGSDGEIVGKTGKTKHSFNSFATQSFDISSVENFIYNGFRTKTFNFTAFIAGPSANLNVQVFMFLEGGEFVNGNETTTVSNDTVKFNIEISNWEFCAGSSNCKTGENGEYIDFVISLKSKTTPSKKAKRPPSDKNKDKKRQEEFDLGEDVVMSLSNELEVDGKMKAMSKNYPKHESQGSKELFTFRFLKFNNRTLYDPTMNMGEESNVASFLTSPLVFAVSSLAAVLVLFA